MPAINQPHRAIASFTSTIDHRPGQLHPWAQWERHSPAWESKGDTVLAAGVEGRQDTAQPRSLLTPGTRSSSVTDASPSQHREQPGPAESVWLQGHRRRSPSAAPGCRLSRMGTQTLSGHESCTHGLKLGLALAFHQSTETTTGV